MTAHAVLGVRIDDDKLWELTRERGCSHPLPDEEARFCCRCGTHAWMTGRKPIGPVDAHGQRLGSLPLFRSGQYAYVGWRVSTSNDTHSHWRDNGQQLDVGTDLTGYRDQLKAALEPLGLWNAFRFGIWAVLDKN